MSGPPRLLSLPLYVAALLVVLAALAGCGGSSSSSSSSEPVDMRYGGPSNHLHVLLALKGVPHTLVLTSHYGVYRSADDGKTWAHVAGDQGQAAAFLMTSQMVQSPTDPNRLYLLATPRTTVTAAGQGIAGIYTSGDAGRTWKLAASHEVFPQGNIYTLAAGAASPAQVYAIVPKDASAQSYSLYVSDDTGARWRELPALPTTSPTGVSADPQHPERLLLWSAGDGLFASGDAGQTWAKVMSVTSGVYAVRRVGETVYASGDNSFYVSTDGGQTFASPGPARTFVDIAVSPSDPSRVYGMQARAIYVTKDGGRTWQPMPDMKRQPAGIAADPQDAATLYVGESLPLGIVVSTDGGAWKQLLP